MTITNGPNLKCFCDRQTDDDCHQDLLHELNRRVKSATDFPRGRIITARTIMFRVESRQE